jgi:hypothetical protein
MLQQSALVEPDPFQQIWFLVIMRYERDLFSLPYYGYLVWHAIFALLTLRSASQKGAYIDFPNKTFTAIGTAYFKLCEGQYWLR